MTFLQFTEGRILKDKNGKVINSQESLMAMAQEYGEEVGKRGYLKGVATSVEVLDIFYMDAQKKILGVTEKPKEDVQ